MAATRGAPGPPHWPISHYPTCSQSYWPEQPSLPSPFPFRSGNTPLPSTRCPGASWTGLRAPVLLAPPVLRGPHPRTSRTQGGNLLPSGPWGREEFGGVELPGCIGIAGTRALPQAPGLQPRLEQHPIPLLTWEVPGRRGPAHPRAAHLSQEEAPGNCGLGSTTWGRDLGVRGRWQPVTMAFLAGPEGTVPPSPAHVMSDLRCHVTRLGPRARLTPASSSLKTVPSPCQLRPLLASQGPKCLDLF